MMGVHGRASLAGFARRPRQPRGLRHGLALPAALLAVFAAAACGESRDSPSLPTGSKDAGAERDERDDGLATPGGPTASSGVDMADRGSTPFVSYGGPVVPLPGTPPIDRFCSFETPTVDLTDPEPSGLQGRFGAEVTHLASGDWLVSHRLRGLTTVSADAAPSALARLRPGPILASFASGRFVAALVGPQPDVGRPPPAGPAGALTLHWLDLADPGDPQTIATLALRGTYGGSHFVETATGGRLFVVTDEIGTDCQAPTKTSWLTVITLSESGVSAGDPTALGDALVGVIAHGETLMTWEGRPTHDSPREAVQSRIRLFDLAESPPRPGPPVTVPLATDGLSPGEWPRRVQAVLNETSVQVFTTTSNGLAGWARYARQTGGAAVESEELVLLGACELPQFTQTRVLFGPGWLSEARTFSDREPIRVEMDAEGRCTTVPASSASPSTVARVAALGGTRVMEAGVTDGSSLEVRLLDGTPQGEFGALKTLTLTAPNDTPVEGLVTLRAYPPPAFDDDAGLLLVHADSALGGLSWVLRYTADDLSPVATGSDWVSLVVERGEGVAFDGAQLQTVDFRETGRPDTGPAVIVVPTYASVFAMGSHGVRVVPPASKAGSGVRRGTYEVFDPQLDPELAPTLASLPAPDGPIVAVGDYLVGILGDLTPRAESPAVLVVDDFRDPMAPVAGGVLRTERAGVPLGECLGCLGTTYALAVPGALVLHSVRPFASLDATGPADGEVSWGASTFHAIDLRDPAAPVRQPPVVMPDAHHTLTVFTQGSSLFHVYRSALDNTLHAPFFVQVLDFADPSAPAPGDPINLPGRLLAVHDGSFYTVEGRLLDSGDTTAMLHRVTVGADGPVVVVSHELGARRVRGLDVSPSGVVRVDVEDNEDLLTTGRVSSLTLATFDAETLTPLDWRSLDGFAVRMRVADERVLYSGHSMLVEATVEPTGVIRTRAVRVHELRKRHEVAWPLGPGGGGVAITAQGLVPVPPSEPGD